MKEQTKTATASTAYGKQLPTPLDYTFSWKDYETFDEVKAANDALSEDEQVKVRNTERQNNARQKALTKALDDAGIVKPTLENDEQLRLREMFKVLMSSKRYTEEQAREQAATALGLTWEQ